MYNLVVTTKGMIVYEVRAREKDIPISVAWAAALPIILSLERVDGYSRVELRTDDGVVLGR